MKETIGITINGDGYKGLLDGLTEIKCCKNSGANIGANGYIACCDITGDAVIFAENKRGTKMVFKIKGQTFEKFKTADEIFKYLNKLKNQRLRRKAHKIFSEL